MMSIQEQKKALRKAVTLQKKAYSPTALSELSSILLKGVEESSAFIKAENILMYSSLPDEVQTHEFIEKWRSSKNIILPVVTGEELELRQYTGKESLHIGAYHILEPDGPVWTDLRHIELSIIPGVAFDHEGHRLGRGKGYYDRLLSRMDTYKIGICFDFQLLDEIPHDTFDICMDEVWTEKREV